MINLKIKTLDSQDHDFSVDDDITVRQFKEHIVTKTGISADLQRLIYCGRVLNDEKPLNEYNVNGKVVHLVERAPPRTRPAPSESPSDGNSSSNSSMGSSSGSSGGNSSGPDGIRNNGAGAFLRSIDITMPLRQIGIPLGAAGMVGNVSTQLNPSFDPTSHLCMNRITVARHMLECAGNIVAYLDNPEQGLHNNDMDILARQTVESTVLEVGISAVGHGDMPPADMQNFVQAFQGAVSAAFRQSGITNVTMATPTVSSESEPATAANAFRGTPVVIGSTINVMPMDTTGEPGAQPSASMGPPGAAAAARNAASTSSGATSATPTSATVTGSASGPAAAGTTTAPPAPPSRHQTTSPTVLAEVVAQMRSVQRRMDPYLTQYYDILQNEPRFADNEARETSQRVYDRISEALHYMAHAQHAISDLMLDLAQTPARHLSCRPILVDQSAYQSLIPMPRLIQPAAGDAGAAGNDQNAAGEPNPSDFVIDLSNTIQQFTQQIHQQHQRQRQQQQQQQQQPASNSQAPGAPNQQQQQQQPHQQDPAQPPQNVFVDITNAIQQVANQVPVVLQQVQGLQEGHADFAQQLTSILQNAAQQVPGLLPQPQLNNVIQNVVQQVQQVDIVQQYQQQQQQQPPERQQHDQQAFAQHMNHVIQNVMQQVPVILQQYQQPQQPQQPEQPQQEQQQHQASQQQQEQPQPNDPNAPPSNAPNNPVTFNVAVGNNADLGHLLQSLINTISTYADVHVDVDVNHTGDDSPAPPDDSPTAPTAENASSSAPAASAASVDSAAPAPPAVSVAPSTASQPSATPAAPAAAEAASQPPRGNSTATHPTTATQTRSTPRPQHVHEAHMPPPVIGQHIYRPMPTQIVSFDRFLPCNSHHIRENRDAELFQHQHAHQQAQHILQHLPHLHQMAPAPLQLRRVPIRLAAAAGPAQLVELRRRTAANLNQSLQHDTDELADLTDEQYNTPIRVFGTAIPIRDLIYIAPSPQTLNRVRAQLREYVEDAFAIATGSSIIDEDRFAAVLARLATVVQESVIAGTDAGTGSYHAVNSINNLVGSSMRIAVALVLEDDSADFGMRMLRELIEFLRRLIGMCVLCAGRPVTQSFMKDVLVMVMTLANDMTDPVIQRFVRHLNAAINSQVSTQLVEVSEFQELLSVRLHAAPSSAPTPMEVEDVPLTPERSVPAPNPASTDQSTVTTAATDTANTSPFAAVVPPPVQPADDEVEPLPNVLRGSESWHANLPSSWLPVISRDLARQRRSPAQPPFSDAYLSGMSSKRRKLIAMQKPSGSDPRALLHEGVRTVLQARAAAAGPSGNRSGASAAAGGPASGGPGTSEAAVSEMLATQPHLHEPQGSYEQALQALVQNRVQADSDFNADRYPNIAKWISRSDGPPK